MSLQAQMDWKSRGFALLYCAIANVNQESLKLEQIVAGVSVEVTDWLSAMDTTRTHFGWGSISCRNTAQFHLPEFLCRFISPLKQVTL